MIITAIEYTFVNLFLFFLVLFFSSLYTKKKININIRTLSLALFSNLLMFFFYIKYLSLNYEIFTISILIFYLIILLFNIYVPILIDRSFTIEIFFKLDEYKNINQHDLKNLFQKNFSFFINRRINYLISKKYITQKGDNISIKTKGRIISIIYKFFKKIYNI